MYHFTVFMAVADFVPVIFFGIAAFLLQRDLYNKMSRTAYGLFTAGTIDVFAAGLLKAIWKLLYAAGICDFEILNHMMMPLQSIGFWLAGIGLIMMLKKKHTAALAVAPPVFGGSVLFIILMSLGLGAICTCMSIVAVRMKQKGAMVLFVLCFAVSMCMGALSGLDFSQAWANWLEQGINSVGQLCLMWGVIILHKEGLADFKI